MTAHATKPQFSERVPRLVHLALVLCLLMLVGTVALIRRFVPVDPSPTLLPILRIVAVVQLMVAAVVTARLRGRIVRRRRDEQPDVWWFGNLGRVVAVWSLAEGAGMTGAVFWYLTGDLPLLVGVTGVAMLLLLRMGPGAWGE